MDVSEIRDWFQGYLDAFASSVNNPSESGRMLKFYAVPLILAGDDGAQVLTTEEDVVAMVQGAAAGLQSDRYSHSELLDSHLIDINRSTALLRGEFSRRRIDGSEIERVGATYFIAVGGPGLRIFAVGAHPPPSEQGDQHV